MYIYIYLYIWTQKKKTYLQSLYKYTQPIFYGTRFVTEERGPRLRHVSTSSAILLMEEWPRLVFHCRAQRLVIWLLQWEAALSFGSDDGASTQPRRKLYLVLFFFKYIYLQCGWTAVVNQLLHTKKRKMALTSLVHLPALGMSTGRTGRDFNLKQKWRGKEDWKKRKKNMTCWFLGLCIRMIFLMVS